MGNESLEQLTKFNEALAKYAKNTEDPRRIDGILLTKFDTIDDKVCRGATILSLHIRVGWLCIEYDLCEWRTRRIHRLRSDIHRSAQIRYRCDCTDTFKRLKASIY